jgi:nicotinamide mononucleotide adenylyltransferase
VLYISRNKLWGAVFDRLGETMDISVAQPGSINMTDYSQVKQHSKIVHAAASLQRSAMEFVVLSQDWIQGSYVKKQR